MFCHSKKVEFIAVIIEQQYKKGPGSLSGDNLCLRWKLYFAGSTG